MDVDDDKTTQYCHGGRVPSILIGGSPPIRVAARSARRNWLRACGFLFFVPVCDCAAIAAAQHVLSRGPLTGHYYGGRESYARVCRRCPYVPPATETSRVSLREIVATRWRHRRWWRKDDDDTLSIRPDVSLRHRRRYFNAPAVSNGPIARHRYEAGVYNYPPRPPYKRQLPTERGLLITSSEV